MGALRFERTRQFKSCPELKIKHVDLICDKCDKSSPSATPERSVYPSHNSPGFT